MRYTGKYMYSRNKWAADDNRHRTETTRIRNGKNNKTRLLAIIVWAGVRYVVFLLFRSLSPRAEFIRLIVRLFYLVCVVLFHFSLSVSFFIIISNSVSVCECYTLWWLFEARRNKNNNIHKYWIYHLHNIILLSFVFIRDFVFFFLSLSFIFIFFLVKVTLIVVCLLLSKNCINPNSIQGGLFALCFHMHMGLFIVPHNHTNFAFYLYSRSERGTLTNLFSSPPNNFTERLCVPARCWWPLERIFLL